MKEDASPEAAGSTIGPMNGPTTGPMIRDVVDLMASLTLMMEEETARLSAYDLGSDLAEMASAKIRLTGMLETELARLDRNCRDWAETLPEEDRAQLTDAFGSLNSVSATNAALLERHMSLSAQMLDAVTAEACRLAGRRASTYSAHGEMGPDSTAPISVNSQY